MASRHWPRQARRVHPSRRDSGQLEEVVVSGASPWLAKAPVPPKQPGKRPILTNNARSETIHKLATYKESWARGQRGIILVWSTSKRI
ncbi:hypothetical protein [Aquincola tertiaricarbonis]|uniref:hypothetical protein n=1 Tax=Aquincola tertiaricarbonis TaxID=391953 RepID=UPI0018DC9899|nr:hypothetical protein [Aquincola tertiaricarbonis]